MSIGGGTLATVLLLPPPFDLIPPCPGLLAHSLAAWRPCISATTTGTDSDAETKLPPTTHEIDVPAHPPLPPITTRRVRGSATLQLRERKRELELEDTQAPENTQTHEHALSVSSSSESSESPSVMRAEKQGAHAQSHAGKDGQGLGERAEGGEDIGIDDDGAPDSSPHHA